MEKKYQLLLKTCLKKKNNIIMFCCIIMLGIINNIAFSKEIPEEVKNKMYDNFKYPPIETAAWGFEDYFLKEEYREDLIKFFNNIVSSDELPNISKLYIYGFLINYGYFNNLQKIIMMEGEEKKVKLDYIGSAYLGYNFYHSKMKSIRDENLVRHIYTLSFNSYKDENYTPDLILDGYDKTTWRIHNINDRDECTLFMKGAVPYRNNVKLLIGNHENDKSFFKYARPKTIVFNIFGDASKEVIIKKTFELEDSKEFQNIDLDMSFFKRLTFKDKDVYYTIKMEIIDFYKGELPQCDIAELHVEPIKD